MAIIPEAGASRPKPAPKPSLPSPQLAAAIRAANASTQVHKPTPAKPTSILGSLGSAAKALGAPNITAKPAAAPFYGSADAISMSPTLVGPEAAASEAAARNAAVARMAAAAPAAPPPPVYRTSGSGRTTTQQVGGGTGGGLTATPSIYVPPESVTAAPAVVQPPAVVAQAAPSEVNVPGESFTTVGSPGSFGAYERRRTSRGPSTGLSVTPEMIRRAASQRLA